MSQNLSSAAVVIGALRAKTIQFNILCRKYRHFRSCFTMKTNVVGTH